MDTDRDARPEPAKGSRDTVGEALQQQEQEARQPGVTNRPLAGEQRPQDQPPRGEKKRESE